MQLSGIERAKLRLIALKELDAANKLELEKKILGNRTVVIPDLTSKGWAFDDSVPWNEKQKNAINLALAGKSFCLIGPAGSGKTTTEKGIVYSLLKNNLLPLITDSGSTKYLKPGVPGIVMTSFTNMAVRQTAKHFSGDVTCVTMHKLLEFGPVWYEIDNPDGTISKTMRFEPGRNKLNPLPRELKIIVIDESSQVDCDLFQLLLNALPDPSAVQFIFLGDLNQLPPVYGSPVLGRKLLDMAIVELTEIYRQALLSPIIRYALRMKDGLPTEVREKMVEDDGEHGCVTIHPWSARLKWEDALLKAQNFIKGAIKTGAYDPMQDMILCPFNVKFGVVELNLATADYLGRLREAQVVEIIAGFEKHYYAVGDKVLVQKQEAIITKIQKNSKYSGARYTDVSKYTLDRWGGARKIKDEDQIKETVIDMDDFDIDEMMDAMQGDVADRKTQSSHIVTVQFMTDHNRTQWEELTEADDEDGFRIETASGINEMMFAYCLTVHKSQGSEWRRVFVMTHWSHAQMCSRELMYTAMTRAKSYLYMLVEPDRVATAGTLTSASKKPRLKGDTLAEKLVSLKAMFDEQDRKKAKQQLLTEEDDES